MTRHRAFEMAKRQIDREIDRKGKFVAEQEWLERVNARTDLIMNSDHTIQLSEKFDAPQFAREFLQIARKFESRHLHIKAHHKTDEMKLGKPVLVWQDVSV
jgi:hypothetical protein